MRSIAINARRTGALYSPRIALFRQYDMVTAAAENRRWRVPPRVDIDIDIIEAQLWRSWLSSRIERLARRSLADIIDHRGALS